MIDDIEDLHRIARIYNIRVVYKDLNARDSRLEGYAWSERMLIVLDKSLIFRPVDHVCVLAEEIGHMLFPPIYDCISYHMVAFWQQDAVIRSQTKYLHSKTERPALIWATDYLIPDEEFWEFVREGPREWWEWLERFEVAPWLMHWKIGFMRAKHNIKGRDVIKRVPPKGGFAV